MGMALALKIACSTESPLKFPHRNRRHRRCHPRGSPTPDPTIRVRIRQSLIRPRIPTSPTNELRYGNHPMARHAMGRDRSTARTPR
jgi:hypothetical protein